MQDLLPISWLVSATLHQQLLRLNALEIHNIIICCMTATLDWPSIAEHKIKIYRTIFKRCASPRKRTRLSQHKKHCE